jgi:hypothetical protein
MYGKVPRYDTVYFEYVKANVTSILGAGQGAYDMNELAAACGVKPTHNFKRRVMQMVELGIIKADVALTGRGSMKAVFMLPEVAKESDYPF